MAISRRLARRLLTSGLICVPLLILAATTSLAQEQQHGPLTRPERTNYEETSLYEDVLQFFRELEKTTPLVRLEFFGKTHEGRDMPLVVLSNPPVTVPSEAVGTGKPVVFIMANIHAGEVEGKEALQILARRLAHGDLRPLADKLVILFAPIYNADGNEKISATGRSRQNGPIGGVGVRENAQGRDLNRDYTKLEAPETRALVKLFNEWDPLMTVDLHTTDGSYHAYHLTYSIPLNGSIDPLISTYHREKMMPTIAEAMLDDHKWRTYYYGNFGSDGGPGRRSGRRGDGGTAAGEGGGERRGGRGGESQPPAGDAPQAETKQPAAGPPPMRTWRAFSSLPRVGQNYVGFRNRYTILSEAYSYLDFKGRIDVTAAFVEEIMRYVINHADEMQFLARQADKDLIRQAATDSPPRIGVEYEQRALPEPVEILVGAVEDKLNPRSGRNMAAMTDKVTPERMNDFGVFVATRSVVIANAYLFPPEEGLKVVVDKLRQHGVHVEALTQPLMADVSTFRITSATQGPSPVDRYQETKLAGTFETERVEFRVGTILVRAAQPLGRLAAYLLEPESDDSFTTGHYLDAYAKPGANFPIRKLMKPASAQSRMLVD